jgi:hypothetical protein
MRASSNNNSSSNNGMTMLRAVIASEAKQSIAATRLDCFVASLLAMTVRGSEHKG